MSESTHDKRYEIWVERVLDAPVERVWRSWHYTADYAAIHESHEARIDFREGGTNTVYFREGEVGEVFEYLEIRAPERLVFCWQGHADKRVTVELSPAEGGGTRARITQACGDDPRWIYNVLDGWAWILDSTAEYLATGRGLGNEAWRARYGGYRMERIEPEGADAPGA